MSEFHSEISKLSPSPVWQFFDKICSIPHPSKHEEALAQFIVNWAKSKNLAVRRDTAGNVFIKKPATAGMENKKTVVLQAHMDMVPQKNEDTVHDFAKDPIQPYIDGEWVTAKGTTLGADNGMGLANCLAVLDSDSVKHGPLEVLLTMDEETGMGGAFGLEPGWLEGEILLNTDSETEGEVYMGCAGGVDASLSFNVQREALPAEFSCFKLTLKGLKGGHSGADIHLGLGNANKLLARFLSAQQAALELRLIDFNGGTLRNAIPREASVTVALPQSKQHELEQSLQQFTQLIAQELAVTEPDVVSLITPVEPAYGVLEASLQQRIIATINACPNGVMRMSNDIEDIVETSLNLGVITSDENKLTILCLIRSLIDSGRQEIEGVLASLAQLAAAEVTFSGAYPGWKPDPKSPIMHIFRDLYEKTYGHKPNIMVIHAGLECGLFKEPYPNMDMISFGPTIRGAHSPDEKVNITSVAQFWDQLTALLEVIPDKE